MDDAASNEQRRKKLLQAKKMLKKFQKKKEKGDGDQSAGTSEAEDSQIASSLPTYSGDESIDVNATVEISKPGNVTTSPHTPPNIQEVTPEPEVTVNETPLPQKCMPVINDDNWKKEALANQKKLEELEKRQAALLSEKELLRQSDREWKDQAEKLKTTLIKLEEANSHLLLETQMRKKQETELTLKYEALSKKMLELESISILGNQDSEEAKKENTKLEQLVKKLEEELSTLKVKCDVLTKKEDQNNLQAKVQKAKLKEYEQQVLSLNSERNKLEKKYTDRDQEYEEIKLHVKEMEKKLHDLQKEYDTNLDRTHTLQQQLQEQKNIMDQLILEKENELTSSEEKSAVILNQERQIHSEQSRQWKVKEMNLMQKIKDLETQFDNKESNIKSFEEKLEEGQNQLSQANSELATLKAKFEDMALEQTIKLQEAISLKEKAMSVEVTGLKDKITNMEKEKREVVEKMKKSDAQDKNTISKLQQQLDSLEETGRQRESDLLAKEEELSSMAEKNRSFEQQVKQFEEERMQLLKQVSNEKKISRGLQEEQAVIRTSLKRLEEAKVESQAELMKLRTLKEHVLTWVNGEHQLSEKLMDDIVLAISKLKEERIESQKFIITLQELL